MFARELHPTHEVTAWVPEADWQTIDRAIGRLAREKSTLEVELGRWLLAARAAAVHRRLGLGSFAEYVDRRLGLDARTAREKLRVAESLEDLPMIRAALADGRRSWSAVREITRVATSETEAAWLAASERMTSRELERAVTGRRVGDAPGDAKDPLLTPRRIVGELLPEQYALVEEALEAMRAQIGASASRAEALVAMAEVALGGRPEGAPAYQTSLTLCVGCARTFQRAGGDVVEVPPVVGEAACCDHEVVGFTRVDEGITDATHVGRLGGVEDPASAGAATHVGRSVRVEDADVATHVGRSVRAADGDVATHMGRAETSEDSEPQRTGAPTHMAPDDVSVARTVEEIVRELGPKTGVLALTHLVTRLVGVDLRSVTPRTRRIVKARDGGSCVVPGCRNFRFVEVHHLVPRQRGGPNTAANLRTLCTAHHRAIHEGTLDAEVLPGGDILFRHEAGVLYGARRE